MVYGVVTFYSSLPMYVKIELIYIYVQRKGLFQLPCRVVTTLLVLKNQDLGVQQITITIFVKSFSQRLKTTKAINLEPFLPEKHVNKDNLRNSHKNKVSSVRTNRARNSFNLSMCAVAQPAPENFACPYAWRRERRRRELLCTTVSRGVRGHAIPGNF